MIEKFEGYESSSIAVDEDGVTLPNIKARYVMLSNWNVENKALMTKKTLAEPEQAGDEIYYGFNGTPAHQLFQSQTTAMIPVNNLSDVFLRARPGAVVQVWFSYWY
jgi:hypothetical protein